MKANELIIRFKLLLSKTSIPTSNNDQALINLFIPTLNQGLLKRVLELDFPPNAIQGWYDTTTKADRNWHHMQAIINQPNSKKNLWSLANYSITNGHLLFCDGCFDTLKSSKMQS